MKANNIQIKGMCENNLKNIDLEIPKGKLVIFTGVSGSGKSSIIFDTVAVEAQRQLNDTYPSYVKCRLPHFEPPKVEQINNLPASIVISQKKSIGSIRSTVGTMTDLAPFIRLLFSRYGKPSAGTSNCYSFNDPNGMCPVCSGIGVKASLDIDKMLDRTLSLNDGAIRFKPLSKGNWQWKIYANSGLFDNDKPLNEYTQKEWNDLLYGEGFSVIVNEPDSLFANSPVQYEGLVKRFHRLYLNRSLNDFSKGNQSEVLRVLKKEICPECHGKRLNQAALDSKIHGYNIADYGKMEIDDLIGVIKTISDPLAQTLISPILSSLQCIHDLGLGYLNLDRSSDTLSGGESQRLKMVRHLRSSLTDMAYIMDEPSVGLHPQDVSRLTDMLKKLRDKGNSILVVEHDRDIIEKADWVIDIGPGAGIRGGQVLFQGSVTALKESGTLTGKYLKKKTALKVQCRRPTGWFKVREANQHNLKDFSVDLPKGVLCTVSGVAGSGKSTLLRDIFMKKHPKAIYVDQSPVGANIRSNTATYVGIMDDIRRLFAKKNGVTPAMFSFNSKGACPVCKGKGEIFPDMAFADPVAIKCDACGGSKYSEQALQYRLKGKNIMEVLSMSADQAIDFFDTPKLLHKLETLREVGLGYLTLGQSTATMSGGECQRLKLAEQLRHKGDIYILDEPTSGLHMADVNRLIKVMDKLVDSGNSVYVIEHNMEVIASSDWIIDLGPRGGKNGGRLIFSGPPAQLLECQASYTAEFLRKSCLE